MENEKILMGHGSGGILSRRLIEDIISPILGSTEEYGLNDGAVIENLSGNYALSTDSYIIDPIFFPGGDIGELAISGTVNDLLMAGAKPLYISLGLIIEEGFEIQSLTKILKSIRKTADAAGARVITGDTKVLPKGKGDKIFINTTGVGEIVSKRQLKPENIDTGDKIIVTGSLGDHSAAVMIARENLSVLSNVLSDCAELSAPILKLMESDIEIKCMRDPTRGGLAAVLNEMATTAGKNVRIEEEKIYVKKEVKAVCEVLGLDPVFMANEGKAVIFVKAEDTDKAMEVLKSFDLTNESVVIGEVSDEDKQGKVILKTITGGERLIALPLTEQLPRIC